VDRASKTVRITLTLDLGGHRLRPRRSPAVARIGPYARSRGSSKLSLTGEFVDAAEAERLGIVNRVIDDVPATVDELARNIADGPPVAIQAIKRGLPLGTDGPADLAADDRRDVHSGRIYGRLRPGAGGVPGEQWANFEATDRCSGSSMRRRPGRR
jgi:enoyl-CoA hydratase/carnithine racemase